MKKSRVRTKAASALRRGDHVSVDVIGPYHRTATITYVRKGRGAERGMVFVRAKSGSVRLRADFLSTDRVRLIAKL